MTELTLRFADHRADIAAFIEGMIDAHGWEAKMRVIGGIVMSTGVDVMTALNALTDEGFDLDSDFESITIESK